MGTLYHKRRILSFIITEKSTTFKRNKFCATLIEEGTKVDLYEVLDMNLIYFTHVLSLYKTKTGIANCCVYITYIIFCLAMNNYIFQKRTRLSKISTNVYL